ncbi:YEATS domain protein, putative (macronuclear) [Tetrahymena thermophila SB210]|uniref:YEATS domain protein, putative n=1 Tax=Tetrahymena thermophila (strain SB210) TaxID=312017 RepID=I7MDN7_TETTS|nr:YEATS domain protein, putative [Tetrahymena thermophila SB210]EAR89954.2 YEATS domain protein, putative [Tetrahymena thermophila SB210]|eukprot:XP_001010199.2 YEATS domain protein, putative [Tetrahymena thermophila SB210]
MQLNTQLKQQTFSKPIVYGTISYSLGANKKQTDKNTHRWCAYVRGPNNEDLSTFIDKVVFVLHETFTDHQRAITKPPFEVVEKGWGEFDILIQIHFKTHYPQLELVHKLKFYGAKSGGNSQSTKKPVVSEFYDEIVFVNPSVEFYDMLRVEKYLQNEEKLSKESKGEGDNAQMEEEQPAEKEEEEYYDWKQHYLKFDAQDHKQKLDDALVVIKEQNEKTKMDLEKCDKDIEALNKEIEQLQKEQDLKQKKLLEEQQLQQQQQQQQSQDGNQFSYPTPNFQNPQSQSQINEFPNEQIRSIPSTPSNIQQQPPNIPIQNIAPPPQMQNQYNPPNQYPMGQPPAAPMPQQQGPPPPLNMMPNSYAPPNPNIKMNNPYQQPPPNMPM